MFEGARERAAAAIDAAKHGVRSRLAVTAEEPYLVAALSDGSHISSLEMPGLITADSPLIAEGTAVVSKNRFTGKVYGYEVDATVKATGEKFNKKFGDIYNAPKKQ